MYQSTGIFDCKESHSTQRRILVFGLCLCSLCAFVFYIIWMTYYLTANHTHVHFGLKNSDCDAKSGVTSRRVNTQVTDYDSYLNASLYDVIGTKASPRDPRVVNLVEKLLDPPSKQMIKLARHVMKTPQAEVVMGLLNGKVGFMSLN